MCVCACVCVCMCVCEYVFACLRESAVMYVPVCACMYVCVACVQMCKCLCAHMHAEQGQKPWLGWKEGGAAGELLGEPFY